jgi:hypothetical protein
LMSVAKKASEIMPHRNELDADAAIPGPVRRVSRRCTLRKVI